MNRPNQENDHDGYWQRSSHGSGGGGVKPGGVGAPEGREAFEPEVAALSVPKQSSRYNSALRPHPPQPCYSSSSNGSSNGGRGRGSSKRAPPRRMDHTYHDYSNYPIGELPTTRKPPTNFPSKLHQILSIPEYSHIISWMPHGRAWKIHDKERLIYEVVPRYFVHSKFESFARQLNGWGFKRLHQPGNDYNAYYHECFLRGLPHLTILLKRVTPNMGKLLPHVEGEPNFYEIEKQFPLPDPAALAPQPLADAAYQGHSAQLYPPPPPMAPGFGGDAVDTLTSSAGYHHGGSTHSAYHHPPRGAYAAPPPPLPPYSYGGGPEYSHHPAPGYPPYLYYHPPNAVEQGYPPHYYPHPLPPPYGAAPSSGYEDSSRAGHHTSLSALPASGGPSQQVSGSDLSDEAPELLELLKAASASGETNSSDEVGIERCDAW